MGDKKRLADTMNEEFWGEILASEDFKDFVRKKYEISYGNIMGQNDVLEETEEV
jgi:hypothetical protein